MAGSKISKFEEYVKSKNPGLVSLKKQNTLILPSGEETDFIHMIAAINMFETSCGPLGSWAGDTCQLITHIKNKSGSIDELSDEAKKYFNTDTSLFNKQDVIADLDASNIYDLYKNSKKTKRLSDTMAAYFSDINNDKRIISFIDNKYKMENFTRDELRKKIYTDFSKANYVSSLLSSYGVSGASYSNHRYAAVYALSDYLYENYKDNYEIIINDINEHNTLNLKDPNFKLGYILNKEFNIKDKTIILMSSDENIIDVVDDEFTIVGEGSCVLSLLNEVSGISSSIVVIVEGENSKFSFRDVILYLDVKDGGRLIEIADNNYDYYILKSGDEDILTIEGSFMNPVKAGATYIAAYDENNNELARIEIIVLESEKEEDVNQGGDSEKISSESTEESSVNSSLEEIAESISVSSESLVNSSFIESTLAESVSLSSSKSSSVIESTSTESANFLITVDINENVPDAKNSIMESSSVQKSVSELISNLNKTEDTSIVTESDSYMKDAIFISSTIEDTQLALSESTLYIQNKVNTICSNTDNINDEKAEVQSAGSPIVKWIVLVVIMFMGLLIVIYLKVNKK